MNESIPDVDKDDREMLEWIRDNSDRFGDLADHILGKIGDDE